MKPGGVLVGGLCVAVAIVVGAEIVEVGMPNMRVVFQSQVVGTAPYWHLSRTIWMAVTIHIVEDVIFF